MIFLDGKEIEFKNNGKLVDYISSLNKENNPVVLGEVNGKLKELNYIVKEEDVIKPIYFNSKIGYEVYNRTLLFILLSSIYKALNKDNIKAKVLFTLGESIFIEFYKDNKFIKISKEDFLKIKKESNNALASKKNIVKERLNTNEAITLFKKYNMDDKIDLLKFRSNSVTNIYFYNDFIDYFYGYMYFDINNIKELNISLFEDGMVLKIPKKDSINEFSDFNPSLKLYNCLKESKIQGETQKIGKVGDLNKKIIEKKETDLLLISEALCERRIGEIARKISEKKDIKFVLIAGPSSSGKTSFSHRLSIQLESLGLKPYPIATDNFFVERVNNPVDENGEYDFECLEAMDTELLNNTLNKLLNGETVEMPTFDFEFGTKKYLGNTLTLGDNDILVIEGIHCLNDKLTYALPKENKFKIYISALNSLNLDDHNRIPTNDRRLIRRMVRDARTRGKDATGTLKMWSSVRRGEEKHIFPYQDSCDEIFNSSLSYEMSVFKSYALSLLYSVSEDSEEYFEAKRLIKLFDYFLPIDSKNIPNNSILREFIGGSIFNV